MRHLYTTYVPPDTTPVPVPVVCQRIATNQIGDRQIISLNEPILDVPGSTVWSGDDSGNSGLHQRFVYQKAQFGVSRIRDWNFIAADAPGSLSASIQVEEGDLIVMAAYVRGTTQTVDNMWQFTPFLAFANTVAQADGSVGHFRVGSTVLQGTPGGGTMLFIATLAGGTPTYGAMLVVSIAGGLSFDSVPVADSEASATPGLPSLINGFDWNQNLAFFVTHESGIDHTVLAPWTERAQVTHSDMYFTLVERWAASENSSIFPEITVDNWSAANTVMGGVAIRAGNIIESLDQQYIVMNAIDGSDFEDGEDLSHT